MIRFLLGSGRVPYLALLALVTATLGVFAARVEMEQSNESMNSLSEAELTAHERFRRLFGSDEDLVLSVTHPRLLGRDGISVLDEITLRVSAIDGVRQVYSLSTATQLVAGPYGAEERPLIRRGSSADEANFEARVREAVSRNPELTGFLISADQRTAAVQIEIEQRPGDDRVRPSIIRDLRTMMAERNGRPEELHLTGIDAQKHRVTTLLERDQAVLIPASVVVLGVVLALFFRRLSGVLIPLAVTGVTLTWTLGCYGLSGYALNPMTSLLPPVLMVLSVCTSVHLYERWLATEEDSIGGFGAILAVVDDLALPCTFTSVTTAAGMLSLLLSDTPAVRIFGAFTALGVMISLGVSLSLVPVCMSFLPRPSARTPRPSTWLDSALKTCFQLSTQRPGAVISVAVLVTAAAMTGIPKIEINTDLVRFLKTSDPLYRDSMYIDRHLAGINTLELVLSRRDGGSLASQDTVQRLSRFRSALLSIDDVAGVQSVLSLLSAIHRAETAGSGPGSDSRSDSRSEWQIPSDEEDVLAAFDLLDAGGGEGLVRRLIDADFRHARVRVQIHAIGSADAAALEDRISTQARTLFEPDYALEVTGAFHRMARDSNRLVENQVKSFLLALALVILAVGIMFRSARSAAVSIVPNVFPILWTAGLMGALHIDLSTGTAMIASVVIGIAVDDTIHYLARFRRERRRGVVEAIRVTTLQTGRALVISSTVLVVGFWVGALGSFVPTIYFSLLTGVTMISALLCDLLVLPACLVLFDRDKAE